MMNTKKTSKVNNIIYLLVVLIGSLQIIGYLSGIDNIRNLGRITSSSPLPLVFSEVKGVETWFAHNSRKGKKIAAVFQKHIVSKTKMKDRKLRSTKERSLYVLIKTIMPAILTENGFFNNEDEVKKLMKNSVRQKVADAHIDAIMEIEKNGIG